VTQDELLIFTLSVINRAVDALITSYLIFQHAVFQHTESPFCQ